jgi:hypothetical protein
MNTAVSSTVEESCSITHLSVVPQAGVGYMHVYPIEYSPAQTSGTSLIVFCLFLTQAKTSCVRTFRVLC